MPGLARGALGRTNLKRQRVDPFEDEDEEVDEKPRTTRTTRKEIF